MYHVQMYFMLQIRALYEKRDADVSINSLVLSDSKTRIDTYRLKMVLSPFLIIGMFWLEFTLADPLQPLIFLETESI